MDELRRKCAEKKKQKKPIAAVPRELKRQRELAAKSKELI